MKIYANYLILAACYMLAGTTIGCDGEIFDTVERKSDTETGQPPQNQGSNMSQTPVDMVSSAESPVQTVVDTDSAAGNTPETGAALSTDSAALSNSVTDTAEPASSPNANAENCVAPSREDYMASHGITADNRDLTDPNVVTAKAYTQLFIFDKSGSMDSAWNEDGGSKWDIARDTMIAAVSPFQQYLSAGAIFFSLEDGTHEVALIDSGKQIDYASATDFLDIWDENMGMYAAGGGTPLMDALEAANDAIAHACELGLLNWPFEITLITDGMPDYWNSQRGLELVKDWYDHGIPTSVVGMPGSDSATQILSDIAAVGSGGELQIDGTVDNSTATAEEIVYTQDSTVTDFEEDMMLLVE
ncbi:MAG: VWA domain-containing protein [Deltaproteobacteria bacterium]|nr:VWA domain-containing protein [Deltaproteobacteria bacterium]